MGFIAVFLCFPGISPVAARCQADEGHRCGLRIAADLFPKGEISIQVIGPEIHDHNIDIILRLQPVQCRIHVYRLLALAAPGIDIQ